MCNEPNLEHSIIKPMPEYVLVERLSNKESFGSFKYKIKENNKISWETVKGFMWKLTYGQPDNSPLSSEDIIGNYESAVSAKGGKVTFKAKKDLHFSVPRKDGGTSFAILHVAYSFYEIKIIDEEPLNTVLKFGAEELKKALDLNGHIAVYGINFLVDSQFLQIEATEILEEISRLMLLYPKLIIEIQGHTDNTGSESHNMSLSEKRALTVKNFILLYGVDESRLKTKGYGMTNPVASNDTEEGRSKNRRVELVKVN